MGCRRLQHRLTVAIVGVIALGVALGNAAPARADLNFTWTQTGIQPREGAAMAFDGATGSVVLFGGLQNGGALLRNTWTWDGESWTGPTPAHSPSPRAYASMAYDPSTGKVVLFGGRNDNDSPMSDTWTWDGSDWTEETPNHSPPKRWAASMAYDAGTGNIVLLGGYGGNACSGVCHDTWTWSESDWHQESPTPGVPNPAPVGAPVAYDAAEDALVLLAGNGSTWTWDGADWHAESPNTSPPGRYDASMAYDSQAQKVVLFGGQTTWTSESGCELPCAYLDDTWTWNGSDWHGEGPTDSPSARAYQSMAYDPLTHQVLLLGGCCSGPFSDVLGDWWTWNGSNWTGQGTGTNPPARIFPSMAYDETRREVVVFGGEQGDCCPGRDDTWTWDGAVWTEESPINRPPARAGAGMAYDSDHQETVLFGGVESDASGDLYADTWTWSGSEWMPATPDHHPSAREGAQMAYDAARHKAVLYGGESNLCDAGGAPYCGDTWTWDGATGDWTHEHPDHRPPAGGFGVMAYDPSTRTAVLFGGECDVPSPGLCGDTWTWDGTDWTKEDPAESPKARWGEQMAYDPANGTVILFGGNECGPGCDRETWEWDGRNWTQVSPENRPPGRVFGAMAFDSNGTPLLFGGYVNDPGPDSGSFSYRVKPTIARVLGMAGGTVATRPASSKHPLATSVTVGPTDGGGQVSIAQLTRSTHKAPAGYAFLPVEDQIAAPRGSPASPLTLEFTLHSSLVAGDPVDPVTLFRTQFGHNPQQVVACADETPPTPNPCISDQGTSGDGAVHFTVLTSSASDWDFALPGVTRSLSIGYHRHRLFKGKLSSPEQACVAGQKVTVFRKHSGPDRKVGTDTTSSTGVYKVGERDAKGTYYASVGQHLESGLGICEATSSKLLHL